MKLRIQNLGPVKDATIDLGKKLTVFCGPNGTGKTWAAYVVYGVLNGRTTMQTSLFDNQDSSALLREGYVQLNVDPNVLYHSWRNEVESLAQQITRIFPVAVDKRQELFGQFSVRVTNSPFEFSENYRRLKLDTKVPFGSGELTIYKVGGENSLTLRLPNFRHENFPPELVELTLSEVILSTVVNQPIRKSVVLPVERNSIYTFSKELSLRNISMLESIRYGAGNKPQRPRFLAEAAEYLRRQSTRYAEAIRDALRNAEDISNIARSESPYFSFTKQVEQDILNGVISIGDDGEVNFSSNRAANKSFSFQLSSSAVKTISSLIIYLKYQAQPNDLIIIDEPELNLHPDNQILLARLFARMINQGLRLLISTHSDYIIRELNNLIMLAEPEPALKKVAQEFGYREDEKISRDDIGVYLFHFKEPGDKHATVEQVPVDHNGFEVKTIEDTINLLNERSQEIYYTMKYGAKIDEDAA